MMIRKIHSLINNTETAREIYRFTQESFATWQVSPFLKNWCSEQGFTAAQGSVLILPNEDGSIRGAVIGTTGDDYHDGALAGRLPVGDYILPRPLSLSTALGFVLEQYQFNHFIEDQASHTKARLVVDNADILKRVIALAEGINLTRDLINLPANHLTPIGLEEATQALAARHRAKVEVTEGDALAAEFPAIHVVGRAAEIAPRLIDLTWGEEGPLITLIGKGVTFDSGGLDLKPSSGMKMMKKDMGGAAHVLGLAHVIMALKLPIRLRVLIGAAENAVSAKSMRPLDVIKTRAGIPVEIGNTDAEGRLILADMLHLASDEKPLLMLDFATLTGAARVALGTELPALFANNDILQQDFIKAGAETSDPLWALPLHSPYDSSLDNNDGTLSSTGSTGYGGAITAALFLQRFVQDKAIPWAHIDVMAWNLAPRPGHPKGGEAMGLRAAFKLIEDYALKTS